MRVAASGVTQTGLPFTVPSALPGPQPTTTSVVSAACGTSVKPQLNAVSADGFAPTVLIAKKFCPPALMKLAPEATGIGNWKTPFVPGTGKLPAPDCVV